MAGKRIILMYISEISGHHSATIAIEKALKTLAPETEVLNINAFNYTNPISEKVVNRIYMGVIKRTPQVWKYLYDNPTVAKKIAKLKDAVHRLNSPKFKNLFDSFRPDAVACAQAFPCGMVADFKKHYGSRMPLVAVLTDFIPHAYWIYDTVDYYVVPADEVAAHMVLKGVSLDRIRAYGIPFDHKFNQPVYRERVIQNLGLDPSLPTVLIMGGGQGLGPIKSIPASLDDAVSGFQEIIVTGSNRKLYHSLKKKIRKYRRRIALLGYVNNVHELMSISSLIITKSGGITTAEAMSKKLPMVIMKPIPGQEASNATFLVKKGAAVRLDDPAHVGRVVDELLLDPGKLSAMQEAAGHIGKPNASLDVARLLLDLCGSSNG